MKIVWLALLSRCALAATVTGNVVLVDSDGRAPKKRDYSAVVVWLEPVGGSARPASSGPKQALMNQRNQTFVPHLLAVEVGTAVDFPNSDRIPHNVFSNYDGQVFDLHLYAPEASRRVVFRRPGIVRVFCNIHENMSAVIAVLSTPYFTVTGAGGRFEIQAPAGRYRLRFWHEGSRADLLGKLEQQATISDADVTLTEIRIALDGAPDVPHKNKYGQEYSPAPEGHVFYPGGRR